MWQHPKFMRSGYMTDTSILDRGVVERNPRTDHFVWLEWPIRHVLVAGYYGTDKSRLREYLASVETQWLPQYAFQNTKHSRIFGRVKKGRLRLSP